MCRCFEVSRSAFYEWLTMPEFDKYSELKQKVKKVFESEKKKYGYMRVHMALLNKHNICSQKMVRKIMKEGSMRGAKRKRKGPYSNTPKKEIEPLPNLLNRDFTATAPNQKWVTDITYIWTSSGWVYLAVILDLFARKVVGWNVSYHPNTDLVLEALFMAVKGRNPGRDVIVHSDQGCQYTSLRWANTLKSLGFKISMSGKGQCWDNAPMESWNGTLKRETDIVSVKKEDLNEVKNVLFEWIETDYNTSRLHSTLGYRSPADFERKWAA